jgi:hypothetical protein
MNQKIIVAISVAAVACATFAQSTKLNLIAFGGISSIAQEAIVAIQSSDGTYINAVDGEVKSDQTRIGSTEKFKLIKHGDGTVSLKTSENTYINAHQGVVKSDQTRIGSTEKFKLIEHGDKTVSFKTSVNTYINAHQGVVKADQTWIGSTEKFKLIYQSGGTPPPPTPTPNTVSWLSSTTICGGKLPPNSVIASANQYGGYSCISYSIYKVDGAPSGASLEVCSCSPVPSGWKVTNPEIVNVSCNVDGCRKGKVITKQ